MFSLITKSDIDGIILFYLSYIGFKTISACFKINLNDDKKLVGYVSKLTYFPGKSMKKIECTRLECKEDGAYIDNFGDRMFMVTVGAKNTFVTARQQPSIVLIQPIIRGNVLTLTFKGMIDVSIDINDVKNNNKEIISSVHGGATTGLDCGDEVGKWLDKFLGQEGHRLLYSDPALTSRRQQRTCNPKYNKWNTYVPEDSLVAFQDSASYHLMSEASLDDLNGRLSRPVSIDNFRPNILVSNCMPYNEDTWSRIYINDVEFTSIKLCNRCVLTTINFDNGVKDTHLEPVKCLKEYRKIVDELLTPVLGIHMFLTHEGCISIGDPVYAQISQPRLKP